MTPDDALSFKLRQRMIRDGICPDCAGRLDSSKIPIVVRTMADMFKRERTCYRCESTFTYSLDED